VVVAGVAVANDPTGVEYVRLGCWRRYFEVAAGVIPTPQANPLEHKPCSRRQREPRRKLLRDTRSGVTDRTPLPRWLKTAATIAYVLSIPAPELALTPSGQRLESRPSASGEKGGPLAFRRNLRLA
jgi:hypothetical protein